MGDLGTAFLLYLYYFGRLAIYVSGLVLGIVIICTKDNITKLLGAMITIGSISGLIGVAYDIRIHFAGMETMIIIAETNSIAQILFNVASGVLLYLYAKKRYGTKLVTGIILIVGGPTLSSVFAVIFNKVATNIDFDNPAQYSYLLNTITLITGLAFSTVWFIIFIKNRYKENELKLLWLGRAVGVASTALNLVISIFMLFALNGNPSHHDIYDAQAISDEILMISTLVVGVLNLLMNIYVVVKGRKASKDIEPAVAGE
ncbi:MAG: hypothetical protein Q4C15_00540 [Eubacteriales bacterium]|nr:hypothetical protein [Eubacteriales bacterium]